MSEGSQLSSMQNLITSVAHLNREKQKIEQITGERFNIFDIVRIGHYEVGTHSPMLAELLDPKGRHGQGSLFLKLFLKTLKPDRSRSATVAPTSKINPDNLPDPETSKVTQEISIEGLGRVDIFITDDNEKKLIIENKIYAGDQKDQITRYLAVDPNATVIYLTLQGNAPSNYSFDSTAEQSADLSNRLACLSYSEDILEWLEDCRKEVTTVAQVRESLTQYIQLLQRLTGKNQNQQMNREIIELITKDQAAYEAYRSLMNVNQELIKSLIPQINGALNHFVKESGWLIAQELKGDNRKYDTYAITTEQLKKVNLRFGIQCQSAYYRGFICGFSYIDQNLKCELSSSVALQFRSAFQKSLPPTTGWPAHAYWEQHCNWTHGTMKSFLFGSFFEDLKALLTQLAEIGSHAVNSGESAELDQSKS